MQLKQIEGKLKLSEEKFKHFVENSSSKIETLNQVIAKSKKDDAVGNLNEFNFASISSRFSKWTEIYESFELYW